MSILTYGSHGVELKTDILDQKEVSRRTRRQIEKIGRRVLNHAAKGETNISAAPNWFAAWKQNTVLEPEAAKLVEEVLAVNGLAARVQRTDHYGMAEDRVVAIPPQELAYNHQADHEQSESITQPVQEPQQVETPQNTHHLAA